MIWTPLKLGAFKDQVGSEPVLGELGNRLEQGNTPAKPREASPEALGVQGHPVRCPHVGHQPWVLE